MDYRSRKIDIHRKNPTPLVSLEGFDIADACAIYERINQTGVRLKNIDVLIARGFRNYPTVVEKDFPVHPE